MRTEFSRGVLSAAMLGVLAMFVASCATNPVTGKRELSLVSESKEIAMGKDAAEETKKSIGVTPDPAIQSYVTTLGMNIAKTTERPNLPWSFTVIEDPAVNAFALPGGPVFVTRGILAHMNSEAQLVSVLGHEVGHITAKHSVSQLSRAQLTQLGLVGMVVVQPGLAQFGDLASQGLGLLFLKFSRDHETQADELGFRYMTQQGYDPHEMAAMFTTLSRMSSGAGKVPQWQSTHPDPGNRVEKTNQRIAAAKTLPPNPKIEHDAFIQRLDGLIFGSNPREGFFRGPTFFHPDLKFQLDFPAGWKGENQTAQVGAVSGAGDAVVLLTVTGGVPPAQALNTFMTKQGMQRRAGAAPTSVNGMAAASAPFALTSTDNSVVAGWVAYVDLDGVTYRMVGYTPLAKIDTYDSALLTSVTSFRRLTDAAALTAKPSRVRLVRTTSAMSVAQFNQTYPSTVSLGTIALINGVDSTGSFAAGTLVKRVATDR